MRNTYTSPNDFSSSAYHGKTYSNSYRDFNTNNLLVDHLEDENKDLKKELHELRKMEKGWFGKNKNYVKKEVIVKNHHYLKEREKITAEVTNLRERYSLLEREKLQLLQKLRDLEARLATQE